MGSAYVCFLYIRSWLRASDFIPVSNKQQVLVKLLYQWKRMCSLIHSLAHVCDHFNEMTRESINAIHGDEIFDLGLDLLRVSAIEVLGCNN